MANRLGNARGSIDRGLAIKGSLFGRTSGYHPGSVPTQASLHFAQRLRDVLATVDAAFVTSSARLSGAGSLLTYACRSLPCDQALLATRSGPLHRLRVDLVADAAGAREETLELGIDGSLFGPTFAGHGAVSTSLRADDDRTLALRPLLTNPPAAALVLPVSVQGSVVGAVALVSAGTALSERDRRAAEPLLDALAIALGAMVTERFLVRLFAAVVPDLLGEDAATDFPSALVRYADVLGAEPAQKRALELCAVAARLATRGDEEARLACDVLERFAQFGAAKRSAPERAQ
jgi:hypothetical protein